MVTIEEMLAARDQRATRQAAALEHFRKPLVSVTTVIPGPVKDGYIPRRILAGAVEELDNLSMDKNWPVLSREVLWQKTGPEALYVIDSDPYLLKCHTVTLEFLHALGRLWDLDVIAPGPHHLSRKGLGVPPRDCLVCTQPAAECGRSRRHSNEELLAAINQIVAEYDRSQSAAAA